MRTSDFNFELPADRIALHPVEPRDAARMLVVKPQGPGLNSVDASIFADHVVRDLPDLLRPGDVLVVNNTRVIPAALEGNRIRGNSAVRVRVNLVRRLAGNCWQAFLRPGRRIALEDRIGFGDSDNGRSDAAFHATVAERDDNGLVVLVFDHSDPQLDALIAQHGSMPLPPYIASRRAVTDEDRDAYQTVFAEADGAVAAPTASLHFTEDLLVRLAERGVHRVTVTLHVGAGTFLPVKSDMVADHQMHAEWGEITQAAATRLNEIRSAGGRIVAVGTTAVRLLESAADRQGVIHPFQGETDMFIKPGHVFRGVDLMMTNFHLPKSTLFMLVSAFCGLEVMRSAYDHAIARGYRFYSYGDSSLLFPGAAASGLEP